MGEQVTECRLRVWATWQSGSLNRTPPHTWVTGKQDRMRLTPWTLCQMQLSFRKTSFVGRLVSKGPSTEMRWKSGREP